MRDALSLLDQAISFGGGQVTDSDVRAMLGAVSRDSVLDLLEALADQDGARLLARRGRAGGGVAVISAPCWPSCCGCCIGWRSSRWCPGRRPRISLDREAVAALAARLSPEDVQLFYEIGTQGQRSLAFAPDPRSGLEMILLRMLAFRPDAGDAGHGAQPKQSALLRPWAAARGLAAAPTNRPGTHGAEHAAVPPERRPPLPSTEPSADDQPRGWPTGPHWCRADSSAAWPVSWRPIRCSAPGRMAS